MFGWLKNKMVEYADALNSIEPTLTYLSSLPESKQRAVAEWVCGRLSGQGTIMYGFRQVRTYEESVKLAYSIFKDQKYKIAGEKSRLAYADLQRDLDYIQIKLCEDFFFALSAVNDRNEQAMILLWQWLERMAPVTVFGQCKESMQKALSLAGGQ